MSNIVMFVSELNTFGHCAFKNQNDSNRTSYLSIHSTYSPQPSHDWKNPWAIPKQSSLHISQATVQAETVQLNPLISSRQKPIRNQTCYVIPLFPVLLSVLYPILCLYRFKVYMSRTVAQSYRPLLDFIGTTYNYTILKRAVLVAFLCMVQNSYTEYFEYV